MTDDPICAGDEKRKGSGLAALFAVVTAAAAARSWLLWGTPLVPGTNGGYYLVQTRALIERGSLGIPDLPLTFMIQAVFAKLLYFVAGRTLETCVLLSVKACDALLPPLVAVPVFLLGRKWCGRAGCGVWPAVAAALIAALGLPALSMTGDFEKNSLGLVWLAGLIASLHAWMTSRTRGPVIAMIVFLGLCGLTHIGVFGAALLLTALTCAADLALLRGRGGFRTFRHICGVALCGVAMVAMVAGLVLWKFDPARIRRLTGALSHPVGFLQTGGHAGALRTVFGPAPALRGEPHLFPPPSGDGPPRMDGAHREGDRGVRMLPQGAGNGLFAFVVLCVLALAWRRRDDLSAGDKASVIGCAVTLALLTGPWVRGDMAGRLRLIAMVPASFAAAFAMAHTPGRWSASVCAVTAFVLTAITTVPLLRRGGRPVISAEAFEELRSLTTCVMRPAQTRVVARHGLEWWTAWALHTHVSQSRALRVSDWSKYGDVLFIQEKGRGRRGPDGASFMSRSVGDGTGAAAEGNGSPPGRGGPGGTGGGPQDGPPGMLEDIPEDAEILYDGTHFRLARVRHPPDTVGRSPYAFPYGDPPSPDIP